MKKVLVIGATCLDIIINIDHLPTTSEDQHIHSQATSLGGQAYNVSDILRHFKVPYTLISPIGTGMYGKIVNQMLKDKNMESSIHLSGGDNGFCLCMVEADGERTFLSYHGVEYCFKKEWMNDIDLFEYDSVYISGLEIEEETGNEIIEFLEESRKSHDITIYFAPGPRINKIDCKKLNRIFKLHPVLHLNEEEALSFSKKANTKEAISFIYKYTKNLVIVTLGDKGVMSLQEEQFLCVPSYKTKVVDTIGAGDAHMGAVIAGLKDNLPLEKALEQANGVAKKVVGVQGASLSEEEFRSIFSNS